MSQKDNDSIEMDLESYLVLYIREEIEFFVKQQKLTHFSRFLTVATNLNGQQIVFEKIDSRAGITGKMIQIWFQILEDSYLGTLLPTFKETLKREPVSSPKFYWFDVGLDRYADRRFQSHYLESGFDLEAYIFQELLAWRDYFCKQVEISYWRTKTKVEVDFILAYQKKYVAIEVKTSHKLTEHDFSGIKMIQEEDFEIRRILVNPHTFSQIRGDGIEIFSVEDFLKELWDYQMFLKSGGPSLFGNHKKEDRFL